MKEYEEFKACMVEQVRKQFSEEYRVEVHRVVKNNQLELESLVILCQTEKVTPQFYLQKYYARYKQGESVPFLAEEIAQAYRQTLAERTWEKIDLSLEYCREKIVYRLVSREKNEEQLAEIPYIPFLNLVITFHCLMVQDENGIGSIRVNNALMNEWGLNHKTLFTLAQKNTMRLFPMRICSMENMLMELLDRNGEMQGCTDAEMAEIVGHGEEPYVLTNKIGVNGAAVILYPDCLRTVVKYIRSDFYLLPSSIHEMLVVPADGKRQAVELKKMVQEVNSQCVEREEILSDDVYFYSQKSGIIEIC